MAGKKTFPGHTEMFAKRLRAKRHAMMFQTPRLRVVLATAHIPLMDIRNALTIGKVFDAIDKVDAVLSLEKVHRFDHVAQSALLVREPVHLLEHDEGAGVLVQVLHRFPEFVELGPPLDGAHELSKRELGVPTDAVIANGYMDVTQPEFVGDVDSRRRAVNADNRTDPQLREPREPLLVRLSPQINLRRDLHKIRQASILWR